MVRVTWMQQLNVRYAHRAARAVNRVFPGTGCDPAVLTADLDCRIVEFGVPVGDRWLLVHRNVPVGFTHPGWQVIGTDRHRPFPCQVNRLNHQLGRYADWYTNRTRPR